ncbi:hypothetical protein [Desulfosporosinus sp. BG]|uniref:hypothetical protein n=1 Tax=Desulfosporosinus sp. BG TaxID=1633135 RepID=UPI00083AABDD|nr:hypothetical protein [Desulfosporosinus sp. BG]ODA40876.1 hypothetical protein DSBG_2317 [Desulfosporosinus sp. BG]
MAAKILIFPTRHSPDEEIEDQYEIYYANKYLANSNSIKTTTNRMQNENYSSYNDTITIHVGFIQFILLIITVIAILVLCFFEGSILKF